MMKSLNTCYYLLYGLGKANKAVQYYFDKNQILYDIYIDNQSAYPLSLKKYDYIIKSSGIAFDTKLLIDASKAQIPVISDLELFYLFNKKTNYLGVTGSNGKTTTTVLIDKILETTYLGDMGGNVGIPLFSLIEEDNEYLVIECSSFMLHNIDKFTPHIYIILNVEHHHLNIHHTFSSYVKDKLKPLKNMTPNDIVIYNYDDKVLNRQIRNYQINKYSFSLKDNNLFASCYLVDDAIYYENELFVKINELILRESHNLQNIMASIIVGKIMGVSDQNILNIIKTFVGLPHRLEKVYDTNDLTIYNDSKATNPFATIKAIETISQDSFNKEVILILGGEEKHEDYTCLKEYLNEINKIYLFGANKETIIDTLLKSKKFLNYEVKNNLEEIIIDIRKRMNKPMIILFSPASASHDMYENFEVRGNEFKNLINKYFSS